MKKLIISFIFIILLSSFALSIVEIKPKNVTTYIHTIGSGSSLSGKKPWLYNDSTYMFFNETKFNNTVFNQTTIIAKYLLKSNLTTEKNQRINNDSWLNNKINSINLTALKLSNYTQLHNDINSVNSSLNTERTQRLANASLLHDHVNTINNTVYNKTFINTKYWNQTFINTHYLNSSTILNHYYNTSYSSTHYWAKTNLFILNNSDVKFNKLNITNTLNANNVTPTNTKRMFTDYGNNNITGNLSVTGISRFKNSVNLSKNIINDVKQINLIGNVSSTSVVSQYLWLNNGGLISTSSMIDLVSQSTYPITFWTGATKNSITAGTKRITIDSKGNTNLTINNLGNVTLSRKINLTQKGNIEIPGNISVKNTKSVLYLGAFVNITKGLGVSNITTYNTKKMLTVNGNFNFTGSGYWVNLTATNTKKLYTVFGNMNITKTVYMYNITPTNTKRILSVFGNMNVTNSSTGNKKGWISIGIFKIESNGTHLCANGCR
jgi:hypothetical protein